MAHNGTTPTEKTLTPKQQTLIASLVKGSSIRECAKQCGVAERTARRWIAQPDFKAALQEAKNAAFTESLDMLRKGTSIALRVLLELMSDEVTRPYVRCQAASHWLTTAIEVHKMTLIEEKVSALEELLKESRS